MKTIRIESQLDRDSYIIVSLSVAYRKLSLKLSLVLGVFFLILLIFQITTFQGFDNAGPYYYMPGLIGVWATFGLPLIFYYQAKKNYGLAQGIQEKTEFEFTSDNIKVTGESFETELDWEEIYRVEEFKNWLMIYESPVSALFVDKRVFEVEDLVNLKALMRSILGERAKLK